MENIQDYLQKETDKKLGVGIMIDANFILEREKKVISASPAIDMALGEGVPEGTWSIFSGPPKSGKTSLALTIAANAQKAGKFVYFYNVEGRIKKRDFLSETQCFIRQICTAAWKTKFFIVIEYV